MDWVALITAAGVIGALISNANMQQTSIMAGKRSARLDQLRERTAGIMNTVGMYIRGTADSSTKVELLDHYHGFITLLQYQDNYTQDKCLLEQLKVVVDLCKAEPIDTKALEHETNVLWWMCNVYIGADFDRLKTESQGLIQRAGNVLREAQTFENFHEKLNVDRYIIFANSPILDSLERYYPMTTKDMKMLIKKFKAKQKIEKKLAKNAKKQEKLAKELAEYLPKNDNEQA